jgi:hypothetical protein
MKLILKILFVGCFCFINANVFSQDVDFVKEIIEKDTCIRFFFVKEFNKKSNKDWFALMEYIHNVVLILPNNDDWEEIDEDTKNNVYYTSSCNNVIFYCIDGTVDMSLLTVNNLLNNYEFKQKIICKFYYSNDAVIVDTSGLYYRHYLRYKNSK